MYFRFEDTTAARREAAGKTLENAQKLQPNSAETRLALGYCQYWVLRDYALAKSTFKEVSKLLPGSSDVPFALGLVTRREGQWDESVAYFEQALALDPRNVEFLVDTALTYAMLRRFPAALKLCDRALDILPNDPNLTDTKARIYQAQGNLKEAAKMLAEVNAQTPSVTALLTKITQLRLERNLGEAIRLLQARQAQFHFGSEIEKGLYQLLLAWSQRDAGDVASAKANAEQARNTLEPLVHKDQQDSAPATGNLAFLYAVLGNKELALKEAERAIKPSPTKDAVYGPTDEENLALIQTMFGENSRAIATLTRLLKTPYSSWLYGPTAITSAHLRLDPVWDPLRGDPVFQKLCEEKH
jgi:tetratricopeptide (TPR) repeat protein